MSTETGRRERARPLAPEERRDALLDAARPVVLEHGRAATTRLIAEAAGVALDGTVVAALDEGDLDDRHVLFSYPAVTVSSPRVRKRAV